MNLRKQKTREIVSLKRRRIAAKLQLRAVGPATADDSSLQARSHFAYSSCPLDINVDAVLSEALMRVTQGAMNVHAFAAQSSLAHQVNQLL